MPAIRLEGIAQVALTVPNLDEAVKFYEGNLGVQVLFRTPNMAMLACGEIRVLLGTPEQNATKQTMFLYFRVADIRAVLLRDAAAVRARG